MPIVCRICKATFLGVGYKTNMGRIVCGTCVSNQNLGTIFMNRVVFKREKREIDRIFEEAVTK